jgi:hypothetical protein
VVLALGDDGPPFEVDFEAIPQRVRTRAAVV